MVPTPLNSSTINEHQTDVPVVKEQPEYPGYEYIGFQGNVIYLKNNQGFYKMSKGRIVHLGRRLSPELLKQLKK